jgi:hypothetical protein
MLTVGSKIRMQDWDNSDNHHVFNVTGPSPLDVNDISIPVAWVSGSGTIPNAKANVAFLIPISL